MTHILMPNITEKAKITITKEQILKQYFGYDSFRPQQAEIIETVLAGQDTMVLMPTGGGKSICFQVPAMVLPGLTLVISPLIALMHDQVQALLAIGIPAAHLNSSLDMEEKITIEKDVTEGRLKLLYISPEKLFTPGYFDWIKTLNISLFAIDEAHCVSTWGHDFRPEYTKLKVLKEAFAHVPMIALTATADKVTRNDLLSQLGILKAKTFVASFDRPNLSLAVAPGRGRLPTIFKFINERPGQAGIIYCLSRKNTEDVANALRKGGINAKHYHALVDSKERAKVQNAFLKDDVQVIVATIAFGMGIDKSNVRWVIHYSLPNNVESFYQEIGRAGRDGQKADTLMFYSYGDLQVRKQMITNNEKTADKKEVDYAKLDRMKQYAEAEICRRRILISYFNEEVEKDCGNCDVCKNPPLKFDASTIAQKALSVIARTNEKVAMGTLIDVLRGSHNKKILDLKYNELKTFGAGKELKMDEWADYIQQMLNSGVVDIAYDEGHSFKLNNVSRAVLFDNKKVQLVRYKAFEERMAAQEELLTKVKTKKEIVRDELFEKLRLLRKQLADEKNMPAFTIFSDATLSDMAQKKPLSEASMMDVSGVGLVKYNMYGELFLNEIQSFIQNSGASARVLGLDSADVTYAMYTEGKTPEEIAENRNLNIVTIISHLAKAYENGKKVDFGAYINKSDYEEIIKKAKTLQLKKGDALKPLYEALNAKHEYHVLRIAMAVWTKKGQN